MNTMKNNGAGTGIRNMRGCGEQGRMPSSLVSLGKAFKKVTFEERAEGGERGSHANIW